MADTQNTERNSFIANVNLLVQHLRFLQELNDRFPPSTVEALSLLEKSLSNLLLLVDRLDLLDAIAEDIPELQVIHDIIAALPDQIKAMTAELEELVQQATDNISDIKDEIDEAVEYWEDVEANLLPKIQELRGVFTSVNIWEFTTDTLITAGEFVEISPYNYTYASLIVTVNGIHVQSFSKVEPVDTTSQFSRYLTFSQDIAAGSEIAGITFVSPEPTVTPERVHHNNTLVGKGTPDDVLGVNSTILNDIQSNSNSIINLQTTTGSLQSQITVSAGKIADNTSTIDNHKADYQILNTKVTNLQTATTSNTNDITGLNTTVLNLTNTVGDLSNDITDTNSTVASNTARIVTLETNFGTASGSIQTLTNSLDTTNGRVTVVEQKIDTLTETFEDSNVGALTTRVSNVEIAVAALPTAAQIPGIVEAATPERVYISDVVASTDASGGVLTLSTLSNKGTTGTKTSTIPVVSPTKAGLMPAAIYDQIVLMQSKINELTNVPEVIIDSSLAANSSQEDLSTAWNSTSKPLIEGSTIENWVLNIRWVYRGTTWYGPYNFSTINIANPLQAGIVKGLEDTVANRGGIFVELDGTMYLLGYDALVASVANNKENITSIEQLIEAINVSIFTNSNKITELVSSVSSLSTHATSLQNSIATNETSINNLITKTDTTNTTVTVLNNTVSTLSSTVVNNTAAIEDVEDSVNTLEATVAGIGSRVTSVETKTSTNATNIIDLQNSVTSNTSRVSTLETRAGTIEDTATALTSKVTTVEGRVAALESSGDNGKVWSTSVTLTLPYVAGTAINIPAYPMGENALIVFLNGLRTDQFTEVSTTSISLTDGINTFTGGAQLLIDCYATGGSGSSGGSEIAGSIAAHNNNAEAHAAMRSKHNIIRLTGDTDMFVNIATGSDTNDGATPATAFRTIQAAVDYAGSHFSLGPHNLFIQVAAGLYPGNLIIGNIGNSTGTLIIRGENMTNTIINGTVFCIGAVQNVGLDRFTVLIDSTNPRNFGIEASHNTGVFQIDNVILDATGNPLGTNFYAYHAFRAKLRIGSNCRFNFTDALVVFAPIEYGCIDLVAPFACSPGTVHGRFCWMRTCSLFNGYAGITADGVVSGERFVVQTQSMVNSNGHGPDYFPGTSPGRAEAATYGLYI